MTEKAPNAGMIGDRHSVRNTQYLEEEGTSLGEYLAILRPHLLKIVGVSLAVGLATLLYMFTKPNIYRASATITPAAEEKQNPALGALASFGISVGGPTKIEDLEALFRSNDLTVRVFRKHDLWPVLLGERFDPTTGRVTPGWNDRLFGNGEPKELGDWDAIRVADAGLAVSVNRKSGNMVVAFETASPVESARIVGYYLEEAKSRLQEEALERATKNKRFIEAQINRTVDALTRERLYALLGQEVEKEMMARNREQFGFRVIDSPRASDTKSHPARGRVAILATLFSLVGASFLFLRRERHPR